MSPKLCPDLNLKWENDFMLLGIKFDSYLENMDVNFNEKISEMEDIVKNWRHRILTPLGRSCIAKTLLLSKVSHLAMVLPSLNKNQLKLIENLIFKFIWQKGSEKVARKDAVMDFTKGGLNFPDITISWKAFKMAWFRRILNSEAKWKLILTKVLNPLNIPTLEGVFDLGISDISKIVKKIKSKFWSETFSVIKPLMLELIYQHPEEIINCTIWGSDLFTRNQSLTNRRQFRGIPDNITFPSDILKNSNLGLEFLSLEECTSKFGPCNEDEYLSLRYLITTSMRKVGADINTINLTRPIRPTIFTLINLSEKGCNKWTKLLKPKYVSENTRNLEIKWNNRLGTMQSLDFWDRCYENTKNIFFNNKIKFFYYQVVRGCLKVNKVVSIFKPHVNPECTFCGTEIETILHLLWECELVKQFITDCRVAINSKIDNYVEEMSRMDFLFGYRDQKIYSTWNYYALHVKYFIWLTRCRESNLSVQGFLSWFLFEIKLDQAHNNEQLYFLDELVFSLS